VLDAVRRILDYPDVQWILIIVSWLSIYYCILEKRR
jgi:hypothetical protein